MSFRLEPGKLTVVNTTFTPVLIEALPHLYEMYPVEGHPAKHPLRTRKIKTEANRRRLEAWLKRSRFVIYWRDSPYIRAHTRHLIQGAKIPEEEVTRLLALVT
jgi:hypothetical protein